MEKPGQLRALLCRVVPHIKANPESLVLFVDQGRVAARVGASLSFEYRYTLSLLVQDFAGDLNAITVPLLAWLAQAQPELLERANGEPFSFESELLDADTADVSIKLPLTENVAVTAREGGGYEVRYVPELDVADRFPGICDTLLQELSLGDAVAVPDPAGG